jgi:hypothetical protein
VNDADACDACTLIPNTVAGETVTCTSATDSQITGCNVGFWKNTAAAPGGHHECEACVAVDNKASDATLSCISATTSQISACKDGYWKNTLGYRQTHDQTSVNDADKCDKCTNIQNKAIGEIVTCNSPTTSQISSCKDGFWKNMANAADKCDACSDVANQASDATITCTSATTSKISKCNNGFLKNSTNVADECIAASKAGSDASAGNAGGAGAAGGTTATTTTAKPGDGDDADDAANDKTTSNFIELHLKEIAIALGVLLLLIIIFGGYRCFVERKDTPKKARTHSDFLKNRDSSMTSTDASGFVNIEMKQEQGQPTMKGMPMMTNPMMEKGLYIKGSKASKASKKSSKDPRLIVNDSLSSDPSAWKSHIDPKTGEAFYSNGERSTWTPKETKTNAGGGGKVVVVDVAATPTDKKLKHKSSLSSGKNGRPRSPSKKVRFDED